MASRALLAILCCWFLASALELRFELDSLDFDALPAQIMKTVAEADSWNRKGLVALDKEDLETAMGCFEEALRILPGYDDAENNRGVVYFRKGDIAGAQEVWERIARRDASYALASYNLALVRLHDRQYDAAARLLERALRADRNFVEAKVRLGAILLDRGETRGALRHLKKAYADAPTHPDVWSYYAYGLVENGDTAAAVSLLKKQGEKTEALKLLGKIAWSCGDTATATGCFSRAVALGADGSLLIDLARVQMENGRCKEALASLASYFAKTSAPIADAYLDAGIAAKECGDIAAAQEYFEKGSARYPHDEILRYNLGQVYFYQKKHAKAEAVWGALADTVHDPSLLHLRAIAAKRLDDLAAAESFIRRAIELDNQAPFHDFLGIVLFLRQDREGAAREFRAALKIDPHLESAQLHLSLCAKSKEELSASAALLEKRLSSCGDSCADVALSLSAIYYSQKQISKAIETLAALPERERDERTLRAQALYYRELQEWSKAIGALETAVKKYVTDPQTDYLLAETHLMAGNYGQAIDRFTRLLLRWTKNSWRIHYQMGYAYLEQNDLGKAKGCFERSLNSKKDNIAARALLAFVYNRQGNVSQARELWKKTLAADPSNPALWINMGVSYEREGNYEQALFHYRKAAELRKDDAQIQINIGNVHAALGQFPDALHAYKQALSSQKREIALYNTFLVYVKKKERERAEKVLGMLEREFAASPNTVRVRAEMASWSGDTARAIALTESIPEKEPGDWIALADLHARRGDAGKAAAALRKVPDEPQWRQERESVKMALAFAADRYDEVISLVRRSGDTGFVAQYNLALASYKLKKYRDVLDLADRLIRRSSGSDRADLCRLAGNAAFSLRQWAKARQWYDQLSNVEQHSAVVQYNLAVASYNLDKVDEAWRHYQKARQIDSAIRNDDIEKRYAAKHGKAASEERLSEADSLYNVAVELQSTGADSSAETIYREVLSKDSTYNLAWNNLGAIYGKRGMIDSAEHAYFKAIERKHDLPETYANLVTLYIELEEYAKARYWLVKGLGHNPESEMLQARKERLSEAVEASAELEESKKTAEER